MKTAFLIIDVQKGYIEDPEFRKTVVPSVEYINEVSGYFRKADLPVIVIQHVGGYKPGDEGFEVANELTVSNSDIRIEETFSNSFWETDLEKILKELEVDTLIVSGFAASFCVLATYNGAIERGFFTLPLLNHSNKDKITVFSGNYAPRKLLIDSTDLNQTLITINLTTFNPSGIDEQLNQSDIFIDLLKNTPECSKPDYDRVACSLTAQQDMSNFNPLSVVMVQQN